MSHMTRHQRLNLARGLERDGLRSPVALEILDLLVGRRWYLFAWPILTHDDRAEVVDTARSFSLSRPGVAPFILKRLAIAGYVEQAVEHYEDGDFWTYLRLTPKALAVAAGTVEVPRRKGPILPRRVEREQIAELEARIKQLWRAWSGYLGQDPAPPSAPPKVWPPEDYSGLPPS